MQLNRHTERGDSVRLTEFKRKHRVQAYSDFLLYLWSESVDVFISVGSTLTRPCGNLFISHEVTESYVQLTCLVLFLCTYQVVVHCGLCARYKDILAPEYFMLSYS